MKICRKREVIFMGSGAVKRGSAGSLAGCVSLCFSKVAVFVSRVFNKGFPVYQAPFREALLLNSKLVLQSSW